MSALDDLCKVPFHEADSTARAVVLRRLADTELYVALAGEPEGETISLLRLPLGDGAEAALACDDEARLAAALGRPVPYAVLPGRELARRLASAGVGLLVNPDAPSAMLLDAGTLVWLTGALTGAPEAEEARLGPLAAPDAKVVAALAEPLGARLADMPGLVEEAVLVSASGSHLLILKGTPEAARPALAKAVAELVAFLPPLPAPLDVTFDTPATLPAGALAIRLEPLPPPPPAPPEPPRPPRLR